MLLADPCNRGAFHNSSQDDLIWPPNVPPFHANARLAILPLLVALSVATLRDRIPRGRTLVITTSLEARVARPVLVDTGSSDCGLLLQQPAVLMGGLGMWRSQGEFRAAGPRLRHAWNATM